MKTPPEMTGAGALTPAPSKTLPDSDSANPTADARAEQRRAVVIAKRISEAPESVKKALSQAFSCAASPRAAIKAQCLQCVGYERDSIKNCTGYSCPLWCYRPFQGSGPNDEATN